ncbi:hypothetical protein LTR85_010219 [Meristemomyces frigidus]|nr:hypothetical protein LTR85_010219 [Meristemomyces frigidus]
MALGFQTLPGEIRNAIYDHYFDRHDCQYVVKAGRAKSLKREKGEPNPVALLYTCKQLYREARQIFLDRVTLELRDHEALKWLCRMLRQQNKCEEIQCIKLDFGVKGESHPLEPPYFDDFLCPEYRNKINAAIRQCGKLPRLQTLEIIVPSTATYKLLLPARRNAFPALQSFVLTCPQLDDVCSSLLRASGEHLYPLWRQPNKDQVLTRELERATKKGQGPELLVAELQKMVELGETFDPAECSRADYALAATLGYAWLRTNGEQAVAVIQGGAAVLEGNLWQPLPSVKPPRRQN